MSNWKLFNNIENEETALFFNAVLIIYALSFVTYSIFTALFLEQMLQIDQWDMMLE